VDGKFRNEFLLSLSFAVKSAGAADITNPGNLIDGDTGTYASIMDSDADTGITVRGRGYLTLVNQEHLTEMILKGFYSGERLSVWVPYYNVVPQLTGDIANTFQVRLRIGFFFVSGITIDWWEGTANLTTGLAGWDWVQFPAEHFDAPNRSQTRAARLQLYAFVHNSTAIGDYTTDNQEIVRIHELSEVIVKARGSTPPNQIWAAGEGRLYGSWIDGRSSSYTEGDLIEEPVGIVESILRDELGMTDDQIDMPSFIDAEYSSIKHHVNIVEEQPAFEIIRKICEQSRFAICMKATGQMKAIDLVGVVSPDTTIPSAHIVHLDIARTRVHSTYAEIRAKYLPEQGTYHDRLAWYAVSPAVRYGRITYKLDLDYCLGTVMGGAHALCTHLFGTLATYSSPGLLSNKKTQITVTTVALTHLDIELGDWIAIDPDLDNHILCNGATWSGRRFMVTDIKVDEDRCTLVAVDITEGLS